MLPLDSRDERRRACLVFPWCVVDPCGRKLSRFVKASKSLFFSGGARGISMRYDLSTACWVRLGGTRCVVTAFSTRKLLLFSTKGFRWLALVMRWRRPCSRDVIVLREGNLLTATVWYVVLTALSLSLRERESFFCLICVGALAVE